MCNWKLFTLAPAMLLVCTGLRAQAPNDLQDSSVEGSQVRVVRISQVTGHMQMDRGTGQGFESGFINLPVVEGAKLRTMKDSWIEIEFEDNSTLRMTPDSEMEFTALRRDAHGTAVSEIQFKHGTMYLSLMKGDSANYRVHVNGKTLSFREASHVRLDVYPSGSLLVVVKGAVTFQDATGTMIADKSKSLTFGGDGAPAQVVRAKDQQPGLYDAWDAIATQYHETHAANGLNGYGSRDLSYYGAFEDLAGCGRVWQPYFTSAAWSPYANGMWAWYSGQGYSFVSPYPWGWLPYHTGDWMSCGPQHVWAWRPGAKFVPLKNQPILLHGPGKPHPIEGGKPAEHPLLVSNDHTLTRSAGSPPFFFFARDSAGLDVPRDGLGKLDRISRIVEAQSPGAPPVHVADFDNRLSDPRVALRLTRMESGRASSSLRPATAMASRGGEARPVMAGAHVGGGYNPVAGHGGGGSSGGGFSAGGSLGSGGNSSASVHVSAPSISSGASNSASSSSASSSHR